MYTKRYLLKLLEDFKSNKITKTSIYKKLIDLPYKDLGFAKLDTHRMLRKGFPEVIYCPGKSLGQLELIVKKSINDRGALVLSKAGEDIYNLLKKVFPKLKYNKDAKIIFYIKNKNIRKKGRILIVTAGTSDVPIAEEAACIAQIMGNKVERLYDVGVAGIHRLFDKKALLEKANVLIVVAGMEGALASVVAGISPKPVIAVPTSVGYGSSFKGLSALLTMLNSCAPGVVVVNIDNGFGAGYFASMINK